MRLLFLILLTILTSDVSAQKLRPAIKTIVAEIAKYDELESEHVGYAGVTTDQYRNFIKLRDKATTEELLSLLNHPNSVVKGYTSWALADNKYPKLNEILIKFLNSGEIAKTQHGCIGSKNELSIEFYYRVFNQYHHNKLSVNDSIFFSIQVQQLDSVILYTKKEAYYLLDRVLENNNANNKTYDRINELAHTKSNTSTLVALAKYKKQDDIPFFIDQGKASFLAISVFPDQQFWSLLLSYKDQIKSLDYFLAIASYKDEQALSLLNYIYQNCDSAQVKLFDEALIKNYCALYHDLILKIWEEYKIIDLTVTERLIADCPEKSSIAFAKGLLTDKKFNLLEIDDNYGTDDSILPLMLSTLDKYNKDLIINICKKNILASKFTNLEAFLDFIESNKVMATTDILLDRLKEKNQAFEIFHITKTLLSFNNSETNKKLTTLLIANQKDWDWGNWSEHFRKTFKDNNIEIK